MSPIRVISTETPFNGLCFQLWGFNECPNVATYHVVNTTNQGDTYMCEPHKEAFMLAYPNAKVEYIKLR